MPDHVAIGCVNVRAQEVVCIGDETMIKTHGPYGPMIACVAGDIAVACRLVVHGLLFIVGLAGLERSKLLPITSLLRLVCGGSPYTLRISGGVGVRDVLIELLGLGLLGGS